MAWKSMGCAAGVLALGLGVAPAAGAADDPWPQFRGSGARGVADGHALPVTWDVEGGRNLKWKTPIPGLGHSGPAIWGDAIFLTSAVGGKNEKLRIGLYGDIEPVSDDSVHAYRVFRLDRKTGQIVWQRTAHEGVPQIKRHTKSSHANPTPATDGKQVVAFFGSEGLYAYDFDGTLKWRADLGKLLSSYYVVPEAHWGFGSSPVIHEGRVIVLADVVGNSFLAALDAATGKELWRTKRDDVPTWGSPTVHVEGDRAQVLVNGFRHIGGYDLATGRELWRMDAGGDIPIPTPYVAHGNVYLTSSHGNRSPILAIKASASGDITLQGEATSSEHVLWSKRGGGSYMPTTVVYGDQLYVLRDNGVLTAYDANSGAQRYQQRLGSGTSSFTASLVAGDDKIYATAESGDVFVVKAGPAFELLATNELGAPALATPAISAGQLFFRTKEHLVAIGASPPAAPAPTPASEGAPRPAR